MDTQRVHHTDNSYPFNCIGTNARAIVNCSLKNRRTRVESNKPGAKGEKLAPPSNHVKLTASNRVVSACHLGQILIRPHAASWFEWTKPARIVRIECSLLGGTVSNSPTSYYIQGTLWSSAYDDVRVVAHINEATLSTKALKGDDRVDLFAILKSAKDLSGTRRLESLWRPREIFTTHGATHVPVDGYPTHPPDGYPYPSSTYPWRRHLREDVKSAKDSHRKIIGGHV